MQRNIGFDDEQPSPVCEFQEVDVAGKALIALTTYDPSKKELYMKK